MHFYIKHMVIYYLKLKLSHETEQTLLSLVSVVHEKIHIICKCYTKSIILIPGNKIHLFPSITLNQPRKQQRTRDLELAFRKRRVRVESAIAPPLQVSSAVHPFISFCQSHCARFFVRLFDRLRVPRILALTGISTTSDMRLFQKGKSSSSKYSFFIQNPPGFTC